MRMLFAAVHESGIGTRLPIRDVGFQGEIGARCRGIGADDPGRTLAGWNPAEQPLLLRRDLEQIQGSRTRPASPMVG
jgi:hypothetical protein